MGRKPLAQEVEIASGLASFQFDYRLKYKGSLIKNDIRGRIGRWGLEHGINLRKSGFKISIFAEPHAICAMLFRKV
jgi:hypothetical protein